MATPAMQQHKVVTREEWLAARKNLLAKEKRLTRETDSVTAARMALPWVKVEKNYVFDSPSGKKSLADLFEGRSQLIVKHFMFGPGWKEGCVGCSFGSDHVGGALVHLEHHDVSYVAISRAPLAEIEPFKKRMGWNFNWVSSANNDFNFDYNVSFGKETKPDRATIYPIGSDTTTSTRLEDMSTTPAATLRRRNRMPKRSPNPGPAATISVARNRWDAVCVPPGKEKPAQEWPKGAETERPFPEY